MIQHIIFYSCEQKQQQLRRHPSVSRDYGNVVDKAGKAADTNTENA